MSKKVDICDVCSEKYPTYHFRYRVKFFVWGYGEAHKNKYDMCDDCWKALLKMVKKTP